MDVQHQLEAIRPPRPLQFRGSSDPAPSPDAKAVATSGFRDAPGALPHLATIQASFGHHDVSSVKAHTGKAASDAGRALGAAGYASGNRVAFQGSPDLHTAAHEAAHVIQQRAGVQLSGGLGQPDDAYEQHADSVADAVVQGRSAESLLDPVAGTGSREGGVQRKGSAEAAASVTLKGPGGLTHAVSPKKSSGKCTVEAPTWGWPGVIWRHLEVELADDGTLKGGSAKGTFKMGALVQTFELAIDADGKLATTFTGSFELAGFLSAIDTTYQLTESGVGATIAVPEAASAFKGITTSGTLKLASQGGLSLSGDVVLGGQAGAFLCSGKAAVTYVEGEGMGAKGSLILNGWDLFLDKDELVLDVVNNYGSSKIGLSSPITKTKPGEKATTTLTLQSLEWVSGKKGAGLAGTGNLTVAFDQLGPVGTPFTIADGFFEEAPLQPSGQTPETPRASQIIPLWTDSGQEIDLDLGYTLKKDGAIAGTASLAKPIKLNSYLTLASLTVVVGKELNHTFEGVVTVNVPKASEAKITISYLNGKFSAEGAISFQSKKMAQGNPVWVATVTAGWNDADGWFIAGEVNVQGIRGVQAFTAGIKYSKQQGLTFSCPLAQWEVPPAAEGMGVTVDGALENVEYNVDKGTFSGVGTLGITFPVIGRAFGQVELAKNKVKRVTLGLESPELAFPKANPVITGSLVGDVTFANGQIKAASIGGNNVQLHVMGMQNPVGLDTKLTVTRDWAVSGYIRLAKGQEVPINQYLTLKSLGMQFDEKKGLVQDGQIAVNIPGVTAIAGVMIDESGFHITGLGGELGFGNLEDPRPLAGKVNVYYDSTNGLSLGGEMKVRISENMVAKGSFVYDAKQKAFDTALELEEITLWEGKTFKRPLFALGPKKVTLFNIYGVDVFLEFGFDLTFLFNVLPIKLGAGVKLVGLSLKDFTYKQIEATVGLTGGIAASLIGTPKLGLGLAALFPELVSIAGGLAFPLTATLNLIPKLTGTLIYLPDGTLLTNAQIHAPLTFGIKAELVPWAEFSALFGLVKKPWQGSPITETEILKPITLAELELDLGDPLPEKPQNPEELVPQEPQKATDAKPEDADVTSLSLPAGGLPPDNAHLAEGEADSSAGDTGPFDINALIGKLTGGLSLEDVQAVLKAADIIMKILMQPLTMTIEILKRIIEFVGDAYDAFIELANLLEAEGSVTGAIRFILAQHLDEDWVDLIVEHVTDIGDIIRDMLHAGTDFSKLSVRDWVALLVESVVSIGSDIEELANELWDLGLDLLEKLVEDGYLWVRVTEIDYDFDDYTSGLTLQEGRRWTTDSYTIGTALVELFDYLDFSRSNSDPVEFDHPIPD